MKELPRTIRQELDDLKAAGTTVSKMTISKKLRCSELKSRDAGQVPQLKRAQRQTYLKFANKHPENSEEGWEKVLESDETKIELFGINSTHRV